MVVDSVGVGFDVDSGWRFVGGGFYGCELICGVVVGFVCSGG